MIWNNESNIQVFKKSNNFADPILYVKPFTGQSRGNSQNNIQYSPDGKYAVF